ncbi:hypothetical protein [Streptomyces sp. NPDC092370]|uniref:hypothetical protein n=1 Tax=Streptomyces sp. NPDC092370 TaxID=3366016 RepID=UPI003810A25E
MSLPSGAMVTSGIDPSADWSRDERHGELLGPQGTGTGGPRQSARMAKFHVPEVLFGPGSLTELGHCALRLGGRRPFLVTDPG